MEVNVEKPTHEDFTKEDLSISNPLSFRAYASDLRFAQHLVDIGEYNSVQESLRNLLHAGVVARHSDDSKLLAAVAHMCRTISQSQLEVAEQLSDVIEALKTRSPQILEGWTEGFTDNAPGDEEIPPVVLVNTNRQDPNSLEEDMVKGHYAAVYYDPWQRQMRNSVRKGMLIVLYASGVGAIAYGFAKHNPETRDYKHGSVGAKEETYVDLGTFTPLKPPISAREMKQIMDYQVNLRRAVRPLPDFAGKALYKHLIP